MWDLQRATNTYEYELELCMELRWGDKMCVGWGSSGLAAALHQKLL